MILTGNSPFAPSTPRVITNGFFNSITGNFVEKKIDVVKELVRKTGLSEPSNRTFIESLRSLQAIYQLSRRSNLSRDHKEVLIKSRDDIIGFFSPENRDKGIVGLLYTCEDMMNSIFASDLTIRSLSNGDVEIRCSLEKASLYMPVQEFFTLLDIAIGLTFDHLHGPERAAFRSALYREFVGPVSDRDLFALIDTYRSTSISSVVSRPILARDNIARPNKRFIYDNLEVVAYAGDAFLPEIRLAGTYLAKIMNSPYFKDPSTGVSKSLSMTESIHDCENFDDMADMQKFANKHNRLKSPDSNVDPVEDASNSNSVTGGLVGKQEDRPRPVIEDLGENSGAERAGQGVSERLAQPNREATSGQPGQVSEESGQSSQVPEAPGQPGQVSEESGQSSQVPEAPAQQGQVATSDQPDQGASGGSPTKSTPDRTPHLDVATSSQV